MSSCSQSLLQLSIASRSSLVPRGEIDITHNVSETLPLEIWDKIFNYLGFQELKLFTEHKVKVLKKPLDGNEDNNRLMLGKHFIFYKEDFFNVVKSVYSVALCCKNFYELTQRERKLLINAALYARCDRQFLFSEQIFIENKQDENIRFKIQNSIFYSYKDFIAKLPSDTFDTNIGNNRLVNQTSIMLFKSMQLEPIKLEQNSLESLVLDRTIEEIKLTEFLVYENPASPEQELPCDSNDKWKCVIQ